MTRVGFGVLGIAAAVVGFSLTTPAGAQGNCEWYAKTALKQQQENEQRRCGLKGPEWSWDLAGHMNWCRTVPPDAWKKQAQQREQQLAGCAKKS